MSTWTIVLLAGSVSFALRLVPVLLLSHRAMPEWLDRAGPLTAPVAFAALATSALVGAASGGTGELLPLVAGVTVGALVAVRTRSTAWAVVAGMVAVWTGAALAALTG
jgi:branched-subunit amino acid transport protein